MNGSTGECFVFSLETVIIVFSLETVILSKFQKGSDEFSSINNITQNF